jgi:hypothetical protein
MGQKRCCMMPAQGHRATCLPGRPMQTFAMLSILCPDRKPPAIAFPDGLQGDVTVVS